jgi:uncharacterized protein with PIN domain
MKFITDRSLGMLSKWLRVLGYDTLSYDGNPDRSFLNKGRREGRVVLTRKRNLGRKQFAGEMMILESDRVERQLADILHRFALIPEWENFFIRCLQCNEKLLKIEKESVRTRVPPYIFETQDAFMTCPRCRRIYWQGTHRERAENWLRTHIPMDRP